MGGGAGDNFAYVRRGRGSMKSVQVRTRGEEGSEIGDFTAYVLYGYPLNVFLQNEKSEFFLLSEEKKLYSN